MQLTSIERDESARGTNSTTLIKSREPMRGDARAIATPVQERDGRTHDINRGSSIVLNQMMLKVL